MVAETLNRELTREDLLIAARLFYKERWDWGRIAQELRCDPKTLYNRRHGVTGDPEDWKWARETVTEEMRQEAPATAWGGLVRAARNGDTSASKELLARTEGAVAQKINLGVTQVARVPAFGEQDPLNHIEPEDQDGDGAGMADDPEAIGG